MYYPGYTYQCGYRTIQTVTSSGEDCACTAPIDIRFSVIAPTRIWLSYEG